MRVGARSRICVTRFSRVAFARACNSRTAREVDARLNHGDLPSAVREGKPFNPFTLEDMRIASRRRNATSIIAAAETKWQVQRWRFRELLAFFFFPPRVIALPVRFAVEAG